VEGNLLVVAVVGCVSFKWNEIGVAGLQSGETALD
jgi:hypothetical protein